MVPEQDPQIIKICYNVIMLKGVELNPQILLGLGLGFIVGYFFARIKAKVFRTIFLIVVGIALIYIIIKLNIKII